MQGLTIDVEKKLDEGRQQMEGREYAKSCNVNTGKVITAVIVADDERRQASVLVAT